MKYLLICIIIFSSCHENKSIKGLWFLNDYNSVNESLYLEIDDKNSKVKRDGLQWQKAEIKLYKTDSIKLQNFKGRYHLTHDTLTIYNDQSSFFFSRIVPFSTNLSEAENTALRRFVFYKNTSKGDLERAKIGLNYLEHIFYNYDTISTPFEDIQVPAYKSE